LIVDIGSVRHVRKFLTEKPVFSRQKNQNFKSLQTGFKHLHKKWGYAVLPPSRKLETRNRLKEKRIIRSHANNILKKEGFL